MLSEIVTVTVIGVLYWCYKPAEQRRKEAARKYVEKHRKEHRVDIG